MLKHMRNLLGGALLAIALGIPYLQAADVAISALPAGTTLTGTEAIPAVQSAATVKTTPAAIKTYVETGGTVTASDPVLDLTQTWNNGAVTFDAVAINVTNTASASTSALLNAKVGGTSIFRIQKDGLARFTGVQSLSGGVNIYTSGGGAVVALNEPIGVTANGGLAWATSTNDPSTTKDLFVYRDAANVLAQRNGTTAQTLRVYDTFTDGSNYGRLAFNTSLTGDWLQIAAETAGTGADNIGLAFTPAGTGAISAHVPDNTAAGGNARGVAAVDLQIGRTAATKVASGAYSAVLGGFDNAASGGYSVAAGSNSNASGGYAAVFGRNSSAGLSSFAAGEHNAASGSWAFTVGESNTASGDYSWIPGGRQATTRGLVGAYAYGSSLRSAQGDAQVIGQPVRRTTTDATPVSLATDGTPAATTIMIVPDGAVMMCTALVVAKPSASITDGVGFDIEGLVYRSGSTTALLSIPNSTAHGGNTLALAATFVANDTLEGLEIQVTGAAATTIYWAGELKCVQVL